MGGITDLLRESLQQKAFYPLTKLIFCSEEAGSPSPPQNKNSECQSSYLVLTQLKKKKDM